MGENKRLGDPMLWRWSALCLVFLGGAQPKYPSSLGTGHLRRFKALFLLMGSAILVWCEGRG